MRCRNYVKLVSFDWSWYSHGNLIPAKFDHKIKWSMKTRRQELKHNCILLLVGSTLNSKLLWDLLFLIYVWKTYMNATVSVNRVPDLESSFFGSTSFPGLFLQKAPPTRLFSANKRNQNSLVTVNIVFPPSRVFRSRETEFLMIRKMADAPLFKKWFHDESS